MYLEDQPIRVGQGIGNTDKQLRAFHHGAIRRMLAIRWHQVREKHIKNKEVRGLLCNIPNIDAFITKRMATYVGKVTRADHESLPKKFLTAWINGSRKNGAPQLSCNNNFADAIHKILPPEPSQTEMHHSENGREYLAHLY